MQNLIHQIVECHHGELGSKLECPIPLDQTHMSHDHKFLVCNNLYTPDPRLFAVVRSHSQYRELTRTANY